MPVFGRHLDDLRELPLTMWGFVLVLLLPVILAVIDVSLPISTAFSTRTILWNQPWHYAGILAILMVWLDLRRTMAFTYPVGNTDTLIVMFLTVLSLALSFTVVANIELADMHLSRLLIAFVLGIAAYQGMKTYQRRFALTMYYGLIAGALLVVPIVMFFLFFREESHALGPYLAWRLPGFGPVRIFGIFYEAGIAVGIGALALKPRPTQHLLLSTVLIILWAMFFWGGGRGAFLSLSVSILLGSLIFWPYFKKIWIIFLTTCVIGAALSLLIWVPDSEIFGIRNMFLNLAREDANAISSGRLERWFATIEMIQNRPFFGHGLSQFSNLWSTFKTLDDARGATGPLSVYFLSYRHVHNIVLEVFLSWGVLGGLLFFGMALKTWVKAIARSRFAVSGERIPALLALNALLIHSNFTGNYVFPHALFYIAIFFGICLAPNREQSRNTNQ